VEERPTVYITASDQHRNGKTLLSRMLADYLLLDGRDPFLIDTDVPAGTLRAYFPGRTQLADFASIEGQIKIFDTMLASTGRDYVIDLTAHHTTQFFELVTQFDYFRELRARSFRIVVFFIVDNAVESLRYFQDFTRRIAPDLIVPVRNLYVGSLLPGEESGFDIPALDTDTMASISHRHFSIREYVLGDAQNLQPQEDMQFKRFVLHLMQAFTDIAPMLALARARNDLES
jgi:hypothetical protein